MKKKGLLLLILPLFIVILLTACAQAHKHSYNETIIAPTCETDGYTLFECECGDTYKDNKVNKLGHNYDEGVHVDATCTEDEHILYTCKNDSSHTKEQFVSPKLGHKRLPVETQVEPTCTQTGIDVVKCERCDEILETIITDELGHYSAEKEITKEATCLEVGHEVYKCERCDYIMYEGDIEPLGHKEYISNILKSNTCTEDGLVEISCERCHEKLEERATEALGHNVITIEAKEPTCTEAGNTEGSYCDRCEEVFKAKEELDALGHSITKTQKTTSAGNYYNLCECDRCDLAYRDNLTTEYTKLYGYNYLKNNYEKGEAFIKLYSEMYSAYVDFANSNYNYSYGTNTYFSIKTFYFSNYKVNDVAITKEEAASVWRTFYIDNPQFMFLWNGYTSNTTQISLIISMEYANYSYRKQVMDELTNVNIELSNLVDTNKDDEYIMLTVHDYICSRIYYAYEEDGKTASKAKNDHNMVGFIMDGHGVCEAYSKSFEYYSYLFDYTSIIVVSSTHMWNMVNLYGTWYGMDVTWDDGATVKWKYFACSESVMNAATAHTPNSADFGIGYQIPIPTLSDKSCTVSKGVITVPYKNTQTTIIPVMYYRTKYSYLYI